MYFPSEEEQRFVLRLGDTEKNVRAMVVERDQRVNHSIRFGDTESDMELTRFQPGQLHHYRALAQRFADGVLKATARRAAAGCSGHE